MSQQSPQQGIWDEALPSSHPYRHLLAPGRIGPLELRNRIAMSPMGNNLAHEDGSVSDALTSYLEARARGGAGLITMGSVAITHPAGSYNPNQAAISDDGFVPGLTALAGRIHAQGAKLAAQLSHGGKSSVNNIRDGQPILVPSIPLPPSGGSDPLMGVTPSEIALMSRAMTAPNAKEEYQEMTREDIEILVSRFADAAERAQSAGLDAVELHAGHGYVLSNFLSRASNRREDEYGGSLENRSRFLVETLRATRTRVGPDFAVWIRLDGAEFFEPDGITPEESREIAAVAVQAGANAIHVSANAAGIPIGWTEGHATHTPAKFLELAAGVRKSVDVPVIAVGRIEPEVAEGAIARGDIDFVAMGRKLLADPELPNKLRAEHAEDVRPCMYQYQCISQIFLREPVICAVNSSTGHEHERSDAPAKRKQRILVVGGGPAGLEAARLAAQMGLDVTVCEAGDRLGGRFALAARTYEPNARFLSWLERQVAALGVEVRLDSPVDVETAASIQADRVIVATGARWGRPDLPGGEADHVFTVDALRGFLDGIEKPLGKGVVILGGGRPGAALADFCVRRGHEVTVLEATGCLVEQMGLPGRWRIVHELQQAGVDLVTNATATAIEPDRVIWRDADDKVRETVANSVLVTSGAEGQDELVTALTDRGFEVDAIGDCTGLGSVLGATDGAARIASGW